MADSDPVFEKDEGEVQEAATTGSVQQKEVSEKGEEQKETTSPDEKTNNTPEK